MNKIKNHFLQKKNYYICAGIITLLILILFASFGAFPFGSKTIAHYDMYHQIMPFITLIFDFFEGNGTLVFTNYLAGGANIVGYLCYFIFSPFYLIVLLFGRNNVLFSINFAFLAQIICSSLTFMWFVRKYFKINNAYQIAISLAYGFSSYVLFNYTFFSWLFLTVLVPILAHNFIKLIKTGKIAGFTATLVAIIFNCYGIGLTGLIVILIFISIFIFTVVPKHKQKITLVKVILSYGLALTLSLFMLGPNALQLKESSRLGGSFTDGLINKDLFFNIPYGITYLVTDFVLLIFNIFFLIKLSHKNRFNAFLMACLVLSILPIFVDGITLVLSLGSYLGYNMRMGYILTFIMFIAAVITIKDISKHETIPQVKQDKSTQHWIIGFFVFQSIITVLMLIIFLYPLSTYLANATVKTFTFALMLYLSSIFIAIGLLILFKYKKGTISKKFFTTMLILLFCVQSIINPIIFTAEGFEDTRAITFLSNQHTELNLKDERLKNFNDIIGRNNHRLAGFNSYSAFASQINKNPVHIGAKFGYATVSNHVHSLGGTVLSDAFFGYEYITSSYELNRPYLTLVSSQQLSDYKNIYLYKNNLSLGQAILINKENTLNLNGNIAYNTQQLYNFLGGNNENVITTINTTNLSNNNLLISKNQIVEFNLPKSDYNKIVYISFSDEVTYIPLPKLNEYEKPLTAIIDSFYDIGFVNKGDAFSYKFEYDKDFNIEDLSIFEINYDEVEKLITNIKPQQVPVKYTANGFEINVTATNNQKLITTNTNLNGRIVTNNNTPVDLGDFELIEVNLQNGENQIISSYKFPYLKTVIVAAIVGVICLVLVIIINKYLLKYKHILNIIYYAAIALICIFAVIIYLVPNIIFMVRLCILKF